MKNIDEKILMAEEIRQLRKEVKQAESGRSCIEKLQQENRELSQVKKQALDLQKLAKKRISIL